ARASIVHSDQVEALRWRDLSAASAIAGLERATRLFGWPFAAAHMLEGADERTHLMMQERRGARENLDLVVLTAHVEPIERADRRARLAFAGAVGRKVEFSDERLRRPMHRLGVEQTLHVPHAPARQRRRRAPIEDEIAVVAHLGGKARLELVRDRACRKHGDRVRPEMRIDRVPQAIDPPLSREIDMRDLSQRMDAGIRAPGAVHDALVAVDRRDRLLEPLLNGDPIRLPLPADERTAVIFDRQREAGHCGFRVQPPTISTCTVGFLPQAEKTAPRTERSMAVARESKSFRRGRGKASKQSKTASSITPPISAPLRPRFGKPEATTSGSPIISPCRDTHSAIETTPAKASFTRSRTAPSFSPISTSPSLKRRPAAILPMIAGAPGASRTTSPSRGETTWSTPCSRAKAA